jgi:hypothetical protein
MTRVPEIKGRRQQVSRWICKPLERCPKPKLVSVRVQRCPRLAAKETRQVEDGGIDDPSDRGK